MGLFKEDNRNKNMDIFAIHDFIDGFLGSPRWDNG